MKEENILLPGEARFTDEEFTLRMKSKLCADRFDIEFSLNRLVEDEQVNGR